MALPRTRWVRLAIALAVAGLAVTACSTPEPGDVPTAAATSAAPTPTATGSNSPSAGPTNAAPTDAAPTSSSPVPEQSVEPSRPVETAPAKPLDKPATTGGAEISLVSVRATSIKADGVGASGPGVLVRLSVRNTTRRSLDTSFVQVSVTSDDGRPGVLVSGNPTRFLGGSIRAGARAEGTYAFVLDGASTVTVAVFVNQGQPVVQFRGRAS